MVQTMNNRLQRINRAYHAHGAFVQDIRVDHGGLDIGVAEKLLHYAGSFLLCPGESFEA